MDYWMLALAVAGVFIQNLFKKNYIAAQGAGLGVEGIAFWGSFWGNAGRGG